MEVFPGRTTWAVKGKAIAIPISALEKKKSVCLQDGNPFMYRRDSSRKRVL
jgi:hypothetical protein